MTKTLRRFTRAALLGMTVGLLAATGGLGCSGSEPDETPITASDVNHVLISADDVGKLAPGETMPVDLAAERTVYHFDVNEPIDFTRVKLVSLEKAEGAMSEALAQLQAEGNDLVASSDKRFLITGDASNLVELTEADLAELAQHGTLVKDKISGATQPRPQAEEECVEHIIYIVTVVVINGHHFTLICTYTVLVCP